MNKIGFQNFRRFKNFNPIEYGGITFLVGRNNAGKSTLVKALLLIDNYFKSDDIDILSFGNDVLEDANIVTYGRALNSEAKKSGENFIHFTQRFENYLIQLTLSGEEDKSFANVHTLVINDLNQKINFVFNLQNRLVSISKGRESQINNTTHNAISDLIEQIEDVKNQLKDTNLKKTSKDYIELISKLESLETRLTDIEKNYKSLTPDKEIIFTLYEEFGDPSSLIQIVDDTLLHSISQYEQEFKNIQNGEEPSERFEELRAFKEFDPIFIESSFSHFMTLMKDFSVAYLGANPSKQSALFAIRDKNNALAQAIHEFEQLKIIEGEEEHRFVLKWMEKFEVGDDFKILMHAGEAYEVRIISNNTEIHLADKGMGSIQAMLLVMRIACVIRRIKNAEKKSMDSSQYRLIDTTTVVIEEPEINLHPALQSKLTDLFLEVHGLYKIDFLIETHSEYVLRRSQVLVAEMEFEIAPNENPFCVYYFPIEAEQPPYRLDYQEDGSFSKNFGTGFFDTASLDTLKLLRLKRERML